MPLAATDLRAANVATAFAISRAVIGVICCMPDGLELAARLST